MYNSSTSISFDSVISFWREFSRMALISFENFTRYSEASVVL
jgi:hypothetical protein